MPDAYLGTVFADSGEVDLYIVKGKLVLTMCEEISCGCDRVHTRKLTLSFSRRDAALLRRKIDTSLREPCMSGQWNDVTLNAMAQEIPL